MADNGAVEETGRASEPRGPVAPPAPAAPPAPPAPAAPATAPAPDAPPQPPPAYLVPANVAWVDGADLGMAEELYLTIVPAGRTVLLRDTARLIWHVAAEGSDDVVRDVAEIVQLPEDQVADDVRAFLADLTTRGLLTPRTP